MEGEDRSDALALGNVRDLLHDLLRLRCVEASGGLVREDYLDVSDHLDGDAKPSSLPSTEAVLVRRPPQPPIPYPPIKEFIEAERINYVPSVLLCSLPKILVPLELELQGVSKSEE